MGVRFRKSVKISKGVKVNFGKTGASVSVGGRGFHQTFHTSGRKTTSVGIPGTGLSYVSTSGGSKKRSSSSRRRTNTSKTRAQQQAASQRQKDAEYAKNSAMVDDFNELIDQIRSIHVDCSDPIDWIKLKNEPAPFDKMTEGPYEEKAKKALDAAKPSILGKLVPSIDKRRMENLEAAIQRGKEQDQQLYSDWESNRELAIQVLNGNIDSYFYVVSEMAPFDEILDFGSDFDIGTDIPELMEVEFHAKTAKVVPNHVLSLTKTGKLSSKNMTKTMHFDIAQDYICSCVLRVAREMFALLPVKYVIIHAMDTVQEPDGFEHDDTVLSVLIRREQMEDIDFDAIDPSDTLEKFQCNMNFKKTQGLKPVRRIEP
jgi:hypothetical protein